MAVAAPGTILPAAKRRERVWRIRITAHMRMLVLILLLMAVAAINYQSNAGWGLVMMLIAIIALSIVHARRNLALVSIASAGCAPFFAGAAGEVAVSLNGNGVTDAHDITVAIPELGAASGHCAQVTATGASLCRVLVPARVRGVAAFQRLRVSTTFPLGLLEISREVMLPEPQEAIVYPGPGGRWQLPAGKAVRINANQQQHGASLSQGADDFLGHRRYSEGDSRRQIDWKAHARGVPLLIKRFTGAGTSEVWCDWNATRGEDEERLSQLARWVLEADQGGLRYGLRLPGVSLAVGQGVQQYRQCMRILAEQPRAAR